MALLILGWLPGAADSHAQDRLVRRFAGEQGLAVPPVGVLARDSTGFLWIGTQGGLYRYDGVEFRRWASDRIIGGVRQIAVAPDGGIAVQAADGTLFELTATGVSPLPPPPGGWTDVRALVFDDRGRLWTVGMDSVPFYRDAGAWTPIPRERLGGERARKLRHAASGGIFVLTDAGLWLIEAPDRAPAKRSDAVLTDLISVPDGRLILLAIDIRVLEIGGGGVRELASRAAGQLPRARPIALAERNGTIWVAFDRYLVAIRPGQAPELVGPNDGLESGGPLLVDHEGSLWLGSFSALFQFPEPETKLWRDRHGLPGSHARFVARSGDVLWVTTWQGTGRVDLRDGGYTAVPVPELHSQSRPCTDSLGVVWLSTADGVVRVHGDHVIGRFPQRVAFMSCAADGAAGLWIGTDQGLFHADAGSGTFRHVTGSLFGDDAMLHAVLQDRDGRLWAASSDRVCHAPATAILAGVNTDWTCEALPAAGIVTALAELPDGTLWAATTQAAILARAEDGWCPLPSVDGLASRHIFALAPSPSGGIWIAGHGILLRVRPRPGCGGWEVLEALGPRNGLLTVGGGDMLDEEDGTLWLATSLGLVRVPPSARFAPAAPPRVALVDARVDTVPVAFAGGLELPADRNRLELRFAALSFRDPGSVRYQVRLTPNATWDDTRGQPSFRWVDLPAGRYRAEVRASVDGGNWSAEPASFSFRVLPPWHLTPWALALFVALGGGLLWAAYRARLAFLLGLERQRTRIALDLHDELGSGLGSIGILAGLLAGGRLDERDRGRIAGEVAGTAEELGNALADIVWSLDPRIATLEELAGRLAGHGARFFAGGDVAFTTLAPREWPAVRLSLPVRRNVLLIGLEALHNAARHAGARQVTLAFAHRGPFWELVVSDDGVGLGDGDPRAARQGRGLAGMRRRAEEIGAEVIWREGRGGGTTVVLRFALAGGGRRRLAGPRGRFGRSRRPRQA